MKKISLAVLVCFASSVICFAQQTQEKTGRVSGTVVDATNQAMLAGAVVLIPNSAYVTETDSLGYFYMDLPLGSVNLEVSYAGYNTLYRYDVEISSGYEKRYVFELQKQDIKTTKLDEVEVSSVRKTVRATSLQTPLSVQRLTSEEIVRMPGAAFDLSRVVQSLPGVTGTRGSTGGYRNDIIVRGGATNENVYYLDGIEVPMINHFNTQGGSGGVEGILNVNFIEDLTLSSSAFNARYDNVLSSVFEIKQRKGNLSQTQAMLRSSVVESQLTMDGPIGKSKKLSYLASARASYLGGLFSVLDLPIRPNYIDYQFKLSYQINKKTALTFIGFGAVDDFKFVTPKKPDSRKLYLLNSLPKISQRSNTFGLSLQRTLDRGYFDVALSFNGFYNTVARNNVLIAGKEDEYIFRTETNENELKLRTNFNFKVNGWDFSYGAGLQMPIYESSFLQRQYTYTGNTPNEQLMQFDVSSTFLKYGLYGQVGRVIFDRVGVNIGLRMDGNTFTTTGNDIWKTISPRASISYSFLPKWKFNVASGLYYKLLPYNTILFKDQNNEYVNRSADYIRNFHFSGGFEFLPSLSTRMTLEGFYKAYQNVPVSIKDKVSLSNIGIDYGTTGNEAIQTTGEGRVYGAELFVQQKLLKNFFFILSYTYFRSFYSGMDGVMKSASWDNQHVGSLSFLVALPKNWSIGMRFLYQGSAPYTPFDEVASRRDYLSTGKGVLDYTQTNEGRLGAYNSGDVRIDKKWYWNKFTFNVYFLLVNFYGATSYSYPYYAFKRNDANTAFVTTDGAEIQPNGSNAIPDIIDNNQVTVVPTIGIIIEYR